MPWVITVSIDPDKTDVGSASAVFTDTDRTVFTYSTRDRLTAATATSFASAAIAARDTWQTQKTREINAVNTLVSRFTALGETATAGTST